MDTQPMSLIQLIGAIQLAALNDPTTPAVSSQEYLTYYNFINMLAIPAWEDHVDVLWDELWVQETNYATITAGTTTISLPSDYKFIAGNIVLTLVGGTTAAPNNMRFPVKKLAEIDLNPQANLREFYITGNIVTGYELQLGWTPQTGDTEIGATISFRYYKHAIQLVNTTDVPEMSMPTFIIFKVAAIVAANNYNMNLYQVNEDKANDTLLKMVTMNTMNSNFQDNYVKEIDNLTGQGFGVPNRLNSGYWTNGPNGQF